MRDFDAEIRRLQEKTNEVRRAKALAQRRQDEKVGRAFREVFPDLPEDPSMMRKFLENLKAAHQVPSSDCEGATDHDEQKIAHDSDDENCESGWESRGAQRPLGQETYLLDKSEGRYSHLSR